MVRNVGFFCFVFDRFYMIYLKFEFQRISSADANDHFRMAENLATKFRGIFVLYYNH